MHYARDKDLLPCTPADLRLAKLIPFSELPASHLMLYDETVSNFFFEFEPKQDIERFLQHAHFAGIVDGRLTASREDLFGVAQQIETKPSMVLAVDVTIELPAPLRFCPDHEAFAAISRGGDFRGRITTCKCGIAGCFSQYAWVRDSNCLALFTVCGASLIEVAWQPFRFVVHAKSDTAAG